MAARASTLFEIAQVINRVGDYDPVLLHGCPRQEAGPIPPRAGNVSMNNDKLASALGLRPFRPWPFGDELTPTHRRWHFERPAEEMRSAQHIDERLYRYPKFAHKYYPLSGHDRGFVTPGLSLRSVVADRNARYKRRIVPLCTHVVNR